MVLLREASSHLYDLSFMYSKHCDLECPFCMYNSSPQVHDVLDLIKLEQFIQTIDFNLINSFGLYGGEPSLFMKENAEIISMLPALPTFMITNGTWSKSLATTIDFMGWVLTYEFTVYVSQTAWHKQFQNAELLELLSTVSKYVILKEPDTQMLPMGRIVKTNPSCTEKCQWDNKPTRIAVEPDGKVIFQTCDGVYPVVGHIANGFSSIHERVLHEKRNRFKQSCEHITRKAKDSVL